MGEVAVQEPAGVVSIREAVREFGAELRPNGLTLLKDEVTAPKVEALFAFLGATHESLRWAIGDALFQGEAIFGDDVWQFQEILNISIEQRRQYLRVAGDVPAQRRRTELTWSHHRSVAPLDSGEQVEWLQRAVDERWTKAELEDAIKQAKGVKEPTRRSYVVEAVCDAAEHIWDAAERAEDGSYLVPGETMEELAAALGVME
jgi:hypothetical protein